jgi:hypothetical protein
MGPENPIPVTVSWVHVSDLVCQFPQPGKDFRKPQSQNSSVVSFLCRFAGARSRAMIIQQATRNTSLEDFLAVVCSPPLSFLFSPVAILPCSPPTVSLPSRNLANTHERLSEKVP